MPRFGISKLLAFLTLIAFFAAALKQSTEFWKELTTSVTLAIFVSAFVFALLASKPGKLFWTTFLVAGIVHWGTAQSGIDWLCIYPGDVVTQFWVLPVRDVIHPSPGLDSATGLNEFVEEWLFFSDIATAANSLFVACVSAALFQWSRHFKASLRNAFVTAFFPTPNTSSRDRAIPLPQGKR